MDHKPLWWVVACTELMAKKAAYILFQVYETFQLPAFSPEMMKFIRRHDFKTVLGNTVKARECLSLLDAIGRSRFWDPLWSGRAAACC